MRERIARWAAVACGALVAGAGLGFLARDILGLSQPVVAVAWLLGAAAAVGAELRAWGGGLRAKKGARGLRRKREGDGMT
jgi:hypothetical protein